MTPEQAAWMKTKVDGFHLSQLQGETTTFLSNTSCEWFKKWPEAAVHFKDSETGIPLTADELSEEQTQLCSYLYRSNTTGTQARVTQFTKMIMKLMGSTTARTRGPSAVEHFIQTEYKDNLHVYRVLLVVILTVFSIAVSPSSINTIVPPLDTSDPSPSSINTTIPALDTSDSSPPSINTIVPTSDFISGPTATPEVLHALAKQLFPTSPSCPNGIHPTFDEFLFHPVPVPDDSLNLSGDSEFSFDLSNKAIDDFLARMHQSTVLSPPRFCSALARIESKVPSGIKKAPRPCPFKGGTGTRHDLYHDSPPAPSVPPMVPVAHPDLLPPAATEPPLKVPLQATVAATREAIVPPVDATPEATALSQAAEPPAVTTLGLSIAVTGEATVASSPATATHFSVPGAAVASDNESMECAVPVVFMFHLLGRWKLTILALMVSEEGHESHANWLIELMAADI
ncbi:uncharacterized protein EDB91DRAFT_1082091 [Suillus paluster]|uniref:uncharacterized protein n=1 Tax=Suillus paluster TaxID=48578 RepID=UPI001B880E7B|nr:uncharacterized protein EDB91DRAFT_1082091 [Suillus paluster]KAG1740108.1 hypothetical protein EDB91DRAFT_1082091 [Suillus paluster]